MNDDFIDELERELRKATTSRGRLATARIPRPPAGTTAIGAAVLVVAVVVAFALTSSAVPTAQPLRTHPATTAPSRPPVPLTQPARGIETLLSGIPQSGTVLGDPAARVTITLFGDLECPICRAFSRSAGFRELIARNVRAGTVKVDYRSFCTATCNAFGSGLFDTQQVAAYAAGGQDRFWQYALIFYDEQGAEGRRYVTANFLRRLAEQTPGLKLTTWARDRRHPALLTRVHRDGSAATAAGVYGTPTVIVTGPGGSAQPRVSTPSYRLLERSIREVS
jgi:protein-disulfide isomerase